MNENKQLSPIANFSGYMGKLKGQIALALPKHLNAERMARLALTAFSTTPALQKCTFESIAASIMTASQLGLEPGVNGAGYLIPYKDKCTFVPGWKGLVDLATRSGRSTVYTGVIYSDQKQGVDWFYSDGTCRKLDIVKQSDLISPNEITHAWAVGWIKDAQMPIIELWSIAKVKAHRDALNKQGNNHYSFKHLEMYAKKVVLLQVLKYMPSSIELSMALDVTNTIESGKTASIIEGFVTVDASQSVDAETGEIQNYKPKTEPVDPYAEIKEEIAACEDIDALELYFSTVPKLKQNKVIAEYNARFEELKNEQQ